MTARKGGEATFPRFFAPSKGPYNALRAADTDPFSTLLEELNVLEPP